MGAIIFNKMGKGKKEELKQLILNEIDYRKGFRESLKNIESLVGPISKHNKIDFTESKVIDIDK